MMKISSGSRLHHGLALLSILFGAFDERRKDKTKMNDRCTLGNEIVRKVAVGLIQRFDKVISLTG